MLFLFENHADLEDHPLVSMSRDEIKELLAASNHNSRLSKKQSELDVGNLVSSLINAPVLKRPRSSLRGGSYAIFASIVKGLCYIYGRRVDGLAKDCELIAVRKLESRISMAPRPISSVTKRRLSTVSPDRAIRSRRSSLSSIHHPVDDVENFDALMDLDALCADLNRRSSVVPAVFQVPQTPNRGKKSRSGSSVSHEEDAFEAADLPADDIDLALTGPLAPLAPLLDTPAVVPISTPPLSPSVPKSARCKPKGKLKGYNPKISFTSVEWATILRAEDITIGENLKPADYAARGAPDYEFVRRFIAAGNKIVPDPVSVPEEDIVSVAEAVDLESIIDELRADDTMDVYEDDIVPDRANNRQSVASSFAAASRRQSIASDGLFDLDHTSHFYPPQDEAEELKIEIKKALSDCHAKQGTMICLSDIAPCSMTSRREAAKTFLQLLVLSTRSDIRFKNTRLSFTEEPCFVLKQGDESSSSDE
jgi:hypothetical protein